MPSYPNKTLISQYIYMCLGWEDIAKLYLTNVEKHLANGLLQKLILPSHVYFFNELNEHCLIRVTYATFGAINNFQDLFLNGTDSQ